MGIIGLKTNRPLSVEQTTILLSNTKNEENV